MGVNKERGQKTLKERISLSGIGVHSGAPVSITIHPADPHSGVSFLRTNVEGSADIEIPAHRDSVGATELCTVLGDPRGACVATVEHLMAALSGLGIDNALIEIDAAEVPVMDGSAHAFVEAIDQVGIVTQSAPKRQIKVLKPVRIEHGGAFAEFRPGPVRRIEVAIEYDCAVIGRQSLALDVTPQSFRRDVSRARTYGYMRDVERLWAAGFALGSSLENSVVIGEDGVVNPEGLRYPDEFVRHKLLDTIGDLALAGAPIIGTFSSYKSGHKLNAMALSALLAEKGAWTITAAETREPAPAEGRGELAAGILAPAFAPEVL